VTEGQRGAKVFVDLGAGPALVGRLQALPSRGSERAAFRYDDAWLRDQRRFALEPALHLDTDASYPPEGRAMFGAFGDSAPDSWGRMLIARAERRRAEREGRARRSLQELDYLLGVNDEARPGALRFTALEGGPFLAASAASVPMLIDLPRLLSATAHIESDTETEEELALVLAPGSSLGGARPKASVRERDGTLSMAKFPRESDDRPIERWEMVALDLARSAGITVADARVEDIDGKAVLIARRFDRNATARVPFLSAMTLLGAVDGDHRSYPEIAEAIRQHGARPQQDLEQLFRRTVFTVLISNTDDHLRNHGVLYAGTDGWVLSPAYDLNPMPTHLKLRVLSTALTLSEDRTASIDLALEAHEYYDLNLTDARRITAEVANVVTGWAGVAAKQGLTRKDRDRMASAFEHEDLVRAGARTT
jgi:serine/threonine-protein kinase HipA